MERKKTVIGEMDNIQSLGIGSLGCKLQTVQWEEAHGDDSPDTGHGLHPISWQDHEPPSSVAVIPEEGKAKTIFLQVSIFPGSEALSHHATDKPSDCFTELTSNGLQRIYVVSCAEKFNNSFDQLSGQL